ncbi:right-handed parallel beta-helix repeat-containing protein [Sphingobacterium cellulitidis]|uniref:right-handed parallel beta-helix repeat-containing protein n=1 Tax=Sphingobacterium cellulitidis TaxID=1768011 RepID=UPI00370D0563
MKKKLIIIISFLLLIYDGFSQSFKYRIVPSYYRNKITNSVNYNFSENSIDLTNYLPKGYVKDGTKDYTIYLQKGLDENRNIVFPNFPVLINDSGLNLSSNSNIYFDKMSKLILKPSSKGSYQMLRVFGKSNVNIINPTLIGDRDYHKGNSGEWGMGISISGSSNITISGANISKCWGDGIYIGHRNVSSRNLIVSNSIIDNNRRNGISVISVSGLHVSNLVISNTNGTNPNSGFVIEPNGVENVIENVVVENLYTFNNKINGVFVHLNKLISEEGKITSISFYDSEDNFSNTPIRVTSSYKGKSNKMKPIKGEVKFQNFKSKNNKGKSVFNKSEYAPSYIIN